VKIKEGYILRNVAGSDIVVAVGKESRRFNKMIKLNPSAAFIWKCLETETTEDEVVARLTENFDVSEEQARRDVAALVARIREEGILV
jgi:hypothetical protein